MKVAVYEDFMCPFCGQFEAASRDALEKQVEAGKVQIQYHVLNFLDDSSTTKYSTRAANALAVVLDTSGPEVAKKFHDLLFENQPAEGSAGLERRPAGRLRRAGRRDEGACSRASRTGRTSSG